MTAPSLSRELEVSVRTVYRDIETLSMSGVPIYATPGKGGGVSLLPGYTFDKTLFSEEEQNELLFAVQSLKAADQKIEPLLSKIGATFQKAPQNWIEVDFSRWGLVRADTERFNLLKAAILGRQVLDLRYCGASGEVTQRKILPLKLIYKDKHWYLQAYCLHASDYRLFKVGRMVDLNLTGETFKDDYSDDIPPIDMETPPFSTVHLKLHIGKNLAFRVYDEFDRSCVIPQEDGSFIVDIDYPMGSWVIGYLFSFGTEIEILEPENLRRELSEYAQKIAEHHKP